MKKNETNGWNEKVPIPIVFHFNIFVLAFLKASISCSKKGDFNRGSTKLCVKITIIMNQSYKEEAKTKV